MLSKAHNYGRPLDCGISWDRYFDVTPSHLFMNPANGPGCTLELPEYYNSFLSQLHNAFPSTASWPLPGGLHGSNSIRAEDRWRWRLRDFLD